MKKYTLHNDHNYKIKNAKPAIIVKLELERMRRLSLLLDEMDKAKVKPTIEVDI